MTENLSEMVKSQMEDNMFSTANLDIPEEHIENTTDENEIVPEENPTITEIPETPTENMINITNLSTWIRTQIFEHLRLPTVTLQGINPDKQLIVISIDESKEVDDQRKIFIFDSADKISVLDLPASDMQVCQNTFKIIYRMEEEGIAIKSYRIRQGLTNIFCKIVDGLLIPYDIVRLKKNDTGILELPLSPNIEDMRTKLAANANFENYKILYKQLKDTDDMETNKDVLNWFLDRQIGITDVNHHIQIDNVIIEIFK